MGTHVSEALLAAGVAVRVFDRPMSLASRPQIASSNNSMIEIVEGDFINQADVERAMDGCDCCVHLVTTTLPNTSNENMIYDVETNLVGTLWLLKMAVKYKLKKVVYASSGGTIYGVPKTPRLSEDHSTNPICSYGIIKLAVEKYLGLYQDLYGLSSVALRLSNPFGERQKINSPQGAIAVFLGAVMQNREIQVWGDGSVVRDYIYITDVVDGVLRALQYTGSEKVFNIGSGYGQSLLDVINVIDHSVGRKSKIVFKPTRSVDIPRNVLDISKATSLLEWSPQISFEQGVQRMSHWVKSELY